MRVINFIAGRRMSYYYPYYPYYSRYALTNPATSPLLKPRVPSAGPESRQNLPHPEPPLRSHSDDPESKRK